MSQTIQFTVDDEQARLIDADAAGKGLTRSQFAKLCVFTQMNRNTTKGVMAELADIRQELEGRGYENNANDTITTSASR